MTSDFGDMTFFWSFQRSGRHEAGLRRAAAAEVNQHAPLRFRRASTP